MRDSHLPAPCLPRAPHHHCTVRAGREAAHLIDCPGATSGPARAAQPRTTLAHLQSEPISFQVARPDPRLLPSSSTSGHPVPPNRKFCRAHHPLTTHWTVRPDTPPSSSRLPLRCTARCPARTHARTTHTAHAASTIQRRPTAQTNRSIHSILHLPAHLSQSTNPPNLLLLSVRRHPSIEQHRSSCRPSTLQRRRRRPGLPAPKEQAGCPPARPPTQPGLACCLCLSARPISPPPPSRRSAPVQTGQDSHFVFRTAHSFDPPKPLLSNNTSTPLCGARWPTPPCPHTPSVRPSLLVATSRLACHHPRDTSCDGNLRPTLRPPVQPHHTGFGPRCQSTYDARRDTYTYTHLPYGTAPAYLYLPVLHPHLASNPARSSLGRRELPFEPTA